MNIPKEVLELAEDIKDIYGVDTLHIIECLFTNLQKSRNETIGKGDTDDR